MRIDAISNAYAERKAIVVIGPVDCLNWGIRKLKYVYITFYTEETRKVKHIAIYIIIRSIFHKPIAIATFLKFAHVSYIIMHQRLRQQKRCIFGSLVSLRKSMLFH